MGFLNDDDDDDSTFAEQKVWLNPGNSGIAMASSNEQSHLHQQDHPQQSGTPTPPAQPDYSGLQVVETGLEVAGGDQAEALSASSSSPIHPYYRQQSPSGQDSTPRFAEHKGDDWNGAPPPQVVPIEQTGMGGYPGGNRLYSTSTGTSQQQQHQQHQYLGGHNPFDPSAGKPKRVRICGLKKVVFWGLVAAITFGVVLAVAVGLGVGLAVSNNSESSTSSASATSTASSTASSTATAIPAATATATATNTTNIQCPSANLTLYSLADSADTKYVVLCGRDYNSDGGAIDIASMNETTFEGCLSECGNTEGCVAVGWGNYYGTNTCWLKSQIGTPNWSSNWYAAVEEDSS